VSTDIHGVLVRNSASGANQAETACQAARRHQIQDIFIMNQG
jgi:hypothetical protein